MTIPLKFDRYTMEFFRNDRIHVSTKGHSATGFCVRLGRNGAVGQYLICGRSGARMVIGHMMPDARAQKKRGRSPAMISMPPSVRPPSRNAAAPQRGASLLPDASCPKIAGALRLKSPESPPQIGADLGHILRRCFIRGSPSGGHSCDISPQSPEAAERPYPVRA